MIQKPISGPILPEFHDRMLFVKLSASYGETVQPAILAGTAAMAARTVSAAAVMPGVIETVTPSAIAGLAMLERRGSIKNVTPVSRTVAKAAHAASNVMKMAMASTASTKTDGDRVAAGSSLIELSPGSDIDECRRILAGDPAIDSVSLVPVRYVKLPARRMRAKGGGITISKAAPDPSALWNLRKIRWAEARNATGFKDAADVRVAVLDTGVDRGHPDLVGRVSQYIFQHPDIHRVVAEPDIVGHGTHVTGTIGALINNAFANKGF